MGYARAAEMTFLAEPMGAATAERLGLVNRVVPADRLMDEARALAERLAKSAPLSLALTKRALNRALGADLASQLDYEAQLQAVAGASTDHAEGVAAFVGKRPPAFTGE
jgi:2-(1,2-epoxy-1,2-dihydrophenyl)acetyl-CoA isomerase